MGVFTDSVTVPIPGIGRADPGIGEHHLPLLHGLAQGAIELEDVGDVLRDLVAGAAMRALRDR